MRLILLLVALTLIILAAWPAIKLLAKWTKSQYAKQADKFNKELSEMKDTPKNDG